MMVAIFTAMMLALIVGRWGPRRLGVAAVLICLGLSAGLFLYEIHSAETGFRMPWLQGMIVQPVTRGRG